MLLMILLIVLLMLPIVLFWSAEECSWCLLPAARCSQMGTCTNSSTETHIPKIVGDSRQIWNKAGF